MLIIRKSPLSGNVRDMELDITDEQLTRWENGEYIQNVFPHLTPDEREFIKTGIDSAEWNILFGEGK